MLLGLSKLKALLILGFSSASAGAISIPPILVGDSFEEFLFREFNPAPEKYAMQGVENSDSDSNGVSYTTETRKFSSFPEVKVSNSELIRGTKKYNNGNYVLYFGADSCPNCTNFLYNSIESPKTWLGANKNVYRDGIFYETYSLSKTKSKLRDLKFIFFSDEIPSMDHRNNDDLAGIPWHKWSTTLLSQGRIKDDYIRYDKSAVNFRKIHSLLIYYFGNKVTGIPVVIIYKEGIPFVLHQDKIEELEKDKERTSKNVGSLTESTADNRDIILRYDLFKHLNYIFESKIIWS
ncbi:DUF6856 family protein [Mycoplasma suis]|uniref:Uncharacterized protein n=2 Tax=Mycoplasma suis TaxID=57372 RepID=F0QS37_MYCSL|nr:hypothetical protein [Mycoplasma suis]ADX98307.1 Conserved hypothetical protein [Mycoplasma suis str. Illinois]CBZ40822.1 hypothetical protein MSUIS_07290 [Mycoplasma suis KI3806]